MFVNFVNVGAEKTTGSNQTISKEYSRQFGEGTGAREEVIEGWEERVR